MIALCSDESLDPKGGYFQLEWPRTWSNATFAEAICNISLETRAVTAIALEPEESVSTLWELPECIYPYIKSLELFRVRNIIIRGNASIVDGDPLLRLSSTIDTFMIRSPVVLQNPTTTYRDCQYPYAMNWTQFFPRFPQLKEFEMSGAQLTGSLPSSLPTLVFMFGVSNNSLSGTIPSTLFSNFLGDTSKVTLDLSKNALTGTFPSTLFWFANDSSEVNILHVWANDNQLSGSVPVDYLPSKTELTHFVLHLENNQLSGTLPSNTFPNKSFGTLSSLRYYLNGNQLTGDIPDALFAPLVDHSDLSDMTFSVASNQLTGTVPDFWTEYRLESMYSVTLDLSDNRLEGSVPSYISPHTFPLTYFDLNLASNQLTGTISSSLMNPGRVTVKYALNLDNNKLEGALPSYLSMGDLGSVVLSLSSNMLIGTLPGAFLTNTGSMTALSLNLANNKFSGPIPSNFLSAFTAKTSSQNLVLSLDLSNCGLSGEIPASIRGNASYATLDLSDNALSGSIPPTLFASSMRYNKLNFNAAYNQLEGSLFFPDLDAFYPSVSMNVSHNDLIELEIEDSVRYIVSLDISYNDNLTGPFPSQLFDVDSKLREFYASHTSINGIPGFEWSSTT